MKHITVFHQANCQPCRLTMKMLDKLGATYDTHPLDDGSAEANAALQRARGLGLTSAPIVEVRGDNGGVIRTVSGYNPKALREIMGLDR